MEEPVAGMPKPLITGVSPIEGKPGTQVTIRGENLGLDQNDVSTLYICGADCTHSVKWKSSSKIVVRVGHANRGEGEIKISTHSGGAGFCAIKFRVFIDQVNPLEECHFWVDESKTVPGREAIRNVALVAEEIDALGLRPSRKMDPSVLIREFGEATAANSNLRMESFNPQCYLLENYYDATLAQLHQGITNLERAKADQERKNEEMHKSHLYSLINCVSTLASLHAQLQENKSEMAVTKIIGKRVAEAREKAESVFRDVLARKDTADATRNALSVLTRFKFIFFLPKTIDENMAKGEYLTIINDYMRAKSTYKSMEVPLFKEVMAEVEAKMLTFKDELTQKLIDSPTSFEEQSKMIKYLKILDPSSDPAWECIASYHRWLENCMWQLQNTHCARAKEEAKQAERFELADSSSRRLFVAELVAFLLDKLQVFWKLANSYNIQDERYSERLEDINGMLNTKINASSWLLLNALVPKKMAQQQLDPQYADKFAKWPPIPVEESRSLMTFSLKTLRKLVGSLLEAGFSSQHVAPLVELCMMVRLTSIEDAIDQSIQRVQKLHTKEHWHLEYLEKGASKTALPDLYENEVSECVGSLREELSSSGFPGEADIFSKEKIRTLLIDKAVSLTCSVEKAMKELLNLKKGEQANANKRHLMTVCNLEYVLAYSLKRIAHRLREAAFQYSDQVYEKSRTRLHAYRAELVDQYLNMRHSAVLPIVRTASYDLLPEEDVSDWAKELLMSVVIAQSELAVNAPQLSTECIRQLVQSSMQAVLTHLAQHPPRGDSACAQCVIDLSAVERALDPFLSLDTKTLLNAYRAEMVSHVDQQKLARCITNMRSCMRVAMESLEAAGATAQKEGEGESDV